MSWKPSLISASLRWCVTYSSILNLPCIYSGKMIESQVMFTRALDSTFNEAWDLRTALHTTKRRSAPDTAGDQLEPK